MFIHSGENIRKGERENTGTGGPASGQSPDSGADMRDRHDGTQQ